MWVWIMWGFAVPRETWDLRNDKSMLGEKSLLVTVRVKSPKVTSIHVCCVTMNRMLQLCQLQSCRAELTSNFDLYGNLKPVKYQELAFRFLFSLNMYMMRNERGGIMRHEAAQREQSGADEADRSVLSCEHRDRRIISGFMWHCVMSESIVFSFWGTSVSLPGFKMGQETTKHRKQEQKAGAGTCIWIAKLRRENPRCKGSCRVWMWASVLFTCVCVCPCLHAIVCLSAAWLSNERCGEWEWLTHAQEPRWFAWSIMTGKKIEKRITKQNKTRRLHRDSLSFSKQSTKACEEREGEKLKLDKRDRGRRRTDRDRDRGRDRSSSDKTKFSNSRGKIVSLREVEDKWRRGAVSVKALFLLLICQTLVPLLLCASPHHSPLPSPLLPSLPRLSPSHQAPHHDPANLKPLVTLVISLLSITL